MAKSKKPQSPTETILGIPADQAKELLGELTPRESEVAELMASGEKNVGIAKKLGISVKTLDIHRAAVKRKLKARGAVDVARVVFAPKFDDAIS